MLGAHWAMPLMLRNVVIRLLVAFSCNAQRSSCGQPTPLCERGRTEGPDPCYGNAGLHPVKVGECVLG